MKCEICGNKSENEMCQECIAKELYGEPKWDRSDQKLLRSLLPKEPNLDSIF